MFHILLAESAGLDLAGLVKSITESERADDSKCKIGRAGDGLVFVCFDLISKMVVSKVCMNIIHTSMPTECGADKLTLDGCGCQYSSCGAGDCLPVSWMCDGETDCKGNRIDEDPYICNALFGM